MGSADRVQQSRDLEGAKVIEVSFSGISRNCSGELRSARNFQQTAANFPIHKRNVSLKGRAAGKRGTFLAPSPNPAGSMDVGSKRCTMAATARDRQRRAARKRERGQSFCTATAAQQAEHSHPEA
jgi:hypothetical protein